MGREYLIERLFSPINPDITNPVVGIRHFDKVQIGNGFKFGKCPLQIVPNAVDNRLTCCGRGIIDSPGTPSDGESGNNKDQVSTSGPLSGSA